MFLLTSLGVWTASASNLPLSTADGPARGSVPEVTAEASFQGVDSILSHLEGVLWGLPKGKAAGLDAIPVELVKIVVLI